MSNSALILVDIQNDYFPNFRGARMPLPEMEKVARHAARLLSSARSNGSMVIHIRHVAASANAPFFRADTAGSEINGMVSPAEDETVILKQRPNSFKGTGSDSEKCGDRNAHNLWCDEPNVH